MSCTVILKILLHYLWKILPFHLLKNLLTLSSKLLVILSYFVFERLYQILSYSRRRKYQYNEDDFPFKCYFLPIFQTAQTLKKKNRLHCIDIIADHYFIFVNSRKIMPYHLWKILPNIVLLWKNLKNLFRYYHIIFKTSWIIFLNFVKCCNIIFEKSCQILSYHFRKFLSFYFGEM